MTQSQNQQREPTSKTQPEIVLQLRNISKRFGSVVANDAINLELRRGEVLALLGENGAGKTTLMNILFGHYVADQGTISVFSKLLPANSPRAAIKAGIGMVHQHFALAENLSVLDNITLGTQPLWQLWQHQQAARQRLATLSQTFGLVVNPDTKVSRLSVGERQRVEILKALYRDTKILILDEPTAVLTPQDTDALFATLHKLTQAGLSVVFISHKLQEVMAVSDRVVVLRAGRVVSDIKTTETSPTHLAELMVGKPLPKTIRQPLAAGDSVLEIAGVTVKNSDNRSLIAAVNLTVRQHEIVGIAGVSGNGQSTLFDLISGQISPSQGKLKLYGQEIRKHSPAAMIKFGVARIPEDRHQTGLIADLSIWENLILESYNDQAFSRAGFLRLNAARHYASKLIEAFDIRCPSPTATVRLLSGGNMQKLILGRVLSRHPKLILANQPTRGLDLNAVTYVHQQLLAARTRGSGILLISEDLEELLSLSDWICVMYQGQLCTPIPASKISVRDIGLMMAGKKMDLPNAV